MYLSQIWNCAERELYDTDQIIFCGYSFPDADIHIKYLIKRAQINRNRGIKFKVCNYYEKKGEKTCSEEKNRYERFLGLRVEYLEKSFEDFANDPLTVIS